MTTPTSLYLINKTATSLILNEGALDIPPYKFGLISSDYASGVSVTYLVNEGMAELSTTLPKASGAVNEVEILPHQPYQGMSEEELKAEQAKAEDPTNGFTTTPIGKAPDVVEAKPAAKKTTAKA